jgi:hypothetical protein
MSLILGPHPVVQPVKDGNSDDVVIIQHVRAYVFGDDDQEKESGGGADCHKQAQGHWIVDTDIGKYIKIALLFDNRS